MELKDESYQVEYLKRKLERREKEVAGLKQKLSHLTSYATNLEEKITVLETRLSAQEQPNDGYREDWTWVRKIVFVLEQIGRPMRSAEIIEELAKREEHLRTHWNQAKYFSAFLNKAVTEQRIQREKRKGERGFYYFL